MPGAGRDEQLRSDVSNGPPKQAVGRLKHVSSPSRNGKFSAGPDKAPQLADCRWHVWNEKDPKDTQDRIEAFGRIIQFQQIRSAERDILQTAPASLFPPNRQESLSEVNPNHEPRGRD